MERGDCEPPAWALRASKHRALVQAPGGWVSEGPSPNRSRPSAPLSPLSPYHMRQQGLIQKQTPFDPCS